MERLGLKVGLEIHFQLDTKSKLFCSCSTAMKEKIPIATIKRKLHIVPSELGEIDLAAAYEFVRDRTFYYQVFKNETCLVEIDEEPPHPVNEVALEIALQIALLLNCEIPDEIHVMRKIVIDGSNTSGFQRTMIVGRNGWFEYKGRKIGITNVCLEEDAAALVREEDGNVYYRLNRLGIPLVEIATEILENFPPEEIQEIAYTIGLMAKSTGRIKRGVGSIRQDINVSVAGGNRVEIKGIQEIELLQRVIEIEVNRQVGLIGAGKKVEKETRAANPDGTTRYMRPLPGAERMYPESDLEPIPIEKRFLLSLKKKLPEPLTKKLLKFKKRFKLQEDVARQMLRSDYLSLFESIVGKKKVKPILVATTFLQTLKDLKRREGVEVGRLEDRHFVEIFDLLARKKIVKEALPELLKYLAANPERGARDAIKELNLELISLDELKGVIKEIVAQGFPLEKTYGIVMSKVRGRIDAKIARKAVEKYFKK